MEPLVSVVTIFLNAKPFFEEAVGSLLAQTYGNWELLLVDDGSSDGSTELARSYADRYPGRIRYLSHEGKSNRGMSESRNLGLRHAAGKYLLMLDADDTLAPEALEKQVQILESHPDVGMAYGTTEWWYSWSGSSGDADRDFVKDLGFCSDQVIEPPLLLEKMLRNEAYKPCGAMIRKDLAERVGGYAKRFRSLYEDQAFLAKVALGSRVFVSSQCWYRYRKHTDSCCLVAVREGTYRESRADFLDWLDGYLAAQGDTGHDLRKIVASELWKLRHPRLSAWSRKARKWAKKSDQAARVSRFRIIATARSILGSKPFDPPVGKVAFGDLRRLEPFSRKWGFERGTPIDRVYIERFLAENAKDIRGHVLEIGDVTYTTRFGGDRVTAGHALSVKPGPGVTIVADLSDPTGLPSQAFDCIILTQTLQLIYDIRAAVCHLHGMLKPGGVLLATVPGISPIPHRDGTSWAKQWYWFFAEPSLRRLFGEFFPSRTTTIQSRGNVMTATAFLYGLSSRDLREEDFKTDDEDYQMLLTIRAVRESV